MPCSRCSFHPFVLALAMCIAGCAVEPAEPPEVSQQALPSTIEPTDLTPDEYIAWYTEALGLDEDHELVLERELSGFIPGSAVHRYAHFYQGARVHAEGLGLIVREGRVTGAVGTVTPDIEAGVEPSVSEEQAILAARLEAERDGARLADGHHCELWLGLGRVRIPSTLRYLCTLVGETAMGSQLAVVDAATGEVMVVRPDVRLNVDTCSADACDLVPATALTGWHGAQQVFVYRDTSTNTYYLHGPSVHVQDGKDNTTYTYFDAPGALTLPDAPEVPYTSTTGIFGSEQEEGGAAYWAADKTLELVAAQWPSLGISQLRIMSNINGQPPSWSGWDGWGTAAYSAAADMILLGNAEKTPAGPLVSLTAFDTVAHEIGHKIAHDYGLWTEWDPSLIPSPDSFYDSLHESFADIFGELAEQHAFGAADWVNGGEYMLGHYYWRSLLDPFTSDPPQPDVMNGINYDASNYHTNASIPSLWFLRLAGGLLPSIGVNSLGVSYDVAPIGPERAFLLFTRTMELTPGGGDDTYVATASKKAAAEFCGPASQEVISAHNAWHSVNVLANPLTAQPYTNPAQSDTNVHPWPARLSWQAQIGPVVETAWEVQVSADATFPAESTHTEVTTSTDTEGSHVVGWVEVFLEPDTQYFWRVRPANADPLFECWRPTSSFTTGSAAPEAFYPEGPDVHPWAIDFGFSHAEGATYYEIEVSETGNIISDPSSSDDGRFDTVIFPPQLIPAKIGEPDQTARITVPKLKELVWHVRGIYQQDGQPTKYSAWSNVLSFQTNEPEVVLFSPPDQSYQYPWPLTMQWSVGPDELPGAEYSLLSTDINNVVGITPHEYGMSDNWLVWYHEAEGNWAADQRGFEWWVTAKGPPLGSELTPESEETREEARPSPRWTIYIDGDDTLVQAQATPGLACIDYGTNIQLQWPPVTGATGYLIESPVFPDNQQIITGNSASITASPASDHHFYVHVSALTEGTSPTFSDGLTPSVDSTRFDYKIWPTKPTIVAIYPDAQDPSYMDFDWTTTYNGSDVWWVQVFEGSSCDPNNVVYLDLNSFPPDTPGGNVYGATLFGFGPGDYSMRISATDQDGCPPSPWSDCAPFYVEAPEPEPDPAMPVVSCGETIQFAGGNEPPFQYVLDFGAEASGQVQLSYDFYCVPDMVHVWTPANQQVVTSGCTGTGSMSIPADYDPTTHQIDGSCVHTTETEPWATFNDVSYLVIDIIPNCLGFSNTAWEVTVECQLQQ